MIGFFLLKVRDDARNVDGYLHGPDSWRRAEDRFRDAMAELEDVQGATSLITYKGTTGMPVS